MRTAQAAAPQLTAPRQNDGWQGWANKARRESLTCAPCSSVPLPTDGLACSGLDGGVFDSCINRFASRGLACAREVRSCCSDTSTVTATTASGRTREANSLQSPACWSDCSRPP
jgi:hypothetical protein